jgi:peptidoglycan glycosyltransferase
MKSSIKKIFWIYTLLFVILISYLCKVALADSRDFITNPYNPRLNRTSDYIKRGSILDANGEVLAYSQKGDDGKYNRYYNDSKVFSNITGYTSKGKTGVESKFNFMLESVSSELTQRFEGLFTDKEVSGDDVVLTIDADLQRFVASQLGTAKGAVVVMEPSTGKILSMVTYPNYNANTLTEDWDYLNSEEADSPLLNRATQGLYPPGSIFKILTAAAALRDNTDSINETMRCNGEKNFDESTRMRCYNSKAHGTEDMIKAFAKSCNVYFSTLGTELGIQKLNEKASEFMFNTDLDFELEYSDSSFSLPLDSSLSAIVETSIGQGKTLVTPLHMAMVASAVANKGVMMKPYIVDCSRTTSGLEKNKTSPEKLAEIMTENEAELVTRLMEEVVNSGTATDAAFTITAADIVTSGSSITSPGAVGIPTGKIQVAGKTGTAENAGGDDHAWFVAFAPADNPKVAVAIVLENAGHGSKAVTMARDIMKYYLTHCLYKP